MSTESNFISVFGARVHNLKYTYKNTKKVGGFTLENSGSGKSSLAFDTIHAEGQRRYLDTFSVYVNL